MQDAERRNRWPGKVWVPQSHHPRRDGLLKVDLFHPEAQQFYSSFEPIRILPLNTRVYPFKGLEVINGLDIDPMLVLSTLSIVAKECNLGRRGRKVELKLVDALASSERGRIDGRIAFYHAENRAEAVISVAEAAESTDPSLTMGITVDLSKIVARLLFMLGRQMAQGVVFNKANEDAILAASSTYADELARSIRLMQIPPLIAVVSDPTALILLPRPN